MAEGYSGVWRRIHDKAGPLAIAFVIAATLFSLSTQAYALGDAASTLSAQLDCRPRCCWSALSLHALPELFALFLPLAAWTHRGPAQGLERAARRDVRDGRHRDPDPRAAAAVETWVLRVCCSRSPGSPWLYFLKQATRKDH